MLAHHVLYAWNRLGLPGQVQGALAHTAAYSVFDDDTSAAAAPQTTRPESVTTTLAAVTAGTADSIAVDPADLRNALAGRILGLGMFRTAAVDAAFRTVPRELFLPAIDLAEAYARTSW